MKNYFAALALGGLLSGLGAANAKAGEKTPRPGLKNGLQREAENGVKEELKSGAKDGLQGGPGNGLKNGLRNGWGNRRKNGAEK